MGRSSPGLHIDSYTNVQGIIDDDRIHITDVSTIITDLKPLINRRPINDVNSDN